MSDSVWRSLKLEVKEIQKQKQSKIQKKLSKSASHIIVENGQGLWTSIPRKNELGKGLLLQIISDCGLTKKEFLELL